MAAVLEFVRAYAVKVDHSTLKALAREAGGTLYSVRLAGSVDDRWAESLNLVRLESTGFARFRLDEANASVSFTLRTGEGTAEIISVLERLDALVDLVNQLASSLSAIELEPSLR